jgi:two-component sensor histidine kinase
MNRLLSSLLHASGDGASVPTAQLNHAAEIAGIGVWIADLVENTAAHSPGCLKLLAPDSPTEFNLFKVLERQVEPQKYAELITAFDTILKPDAPASVVVDICLREGQAASRWVKMTLAVQVDQRTQNPTQITAVFQDASTEQDARAQAQALIQEMNHRVKNMLSVVQSVAYQSFRHDIDSSGHFSDFQGRLRALSKAQDLLIEEKFEGASLSALAERIVGSCGAPADRLTIRGFPIQVGPKQAVSFSIIFHELSINALKYGAFSLPSGNVELSWERNKMAGMFKLRWIESNGPTVIDPMEKGFGVRMIERAIALEFGGAVSTEFAPEGLSCVMTIPYKTLDQDRV